MGSGAPSCSRYAASPMTYTSGCSGACNSGVTATLPCRAVVSPSVAVSETALAPAAQMSVRAGITSPLFNVIRAPALGVGLEHGQLEAPQHVVADRHRVDHALQAEAVAYDPVQAEVVRLAAQGEDQEVVRHRAVVGRDPAPREVDARDFDHAELEVRLAAQDTAYRLGDLLGLEAGRGDLVEERLEEMVIVPVEQHDVDRRSAERAGGPQAAEARAEDDDGGSHRVRRATRAPPRCRSRAPRSPRRAPPLPRRRSSSRSRRWRPAAGRARSSGRTPSDVPARTSPCRRRFGRR